MRKEKSLSVLKKDLDKVFNAFIRHRDSLDGLCNDGWFTCISCEEHKLIKDMDAGHFYSAGHHSAVRWDEDNVHGQCQKCNRFLHGNLLGYREGLLKKIGQERLTKLEIRRHNKTLMSRFEVSLLIEQYKQKLKG